MLVFRIVPVVCALLLGACTSSPSEIDEVVANSLGDLDERPMWTVDGRFKKWQDESLTKQEREQHLYRVGFYSTQKRSDLDLCYQFARTKVETEIRQSIGQALSSVIEEAVDAGDITTGESTRMQSVTTVSAAKGALAGLELEERFWQQVKRANNEGQTYECFVLTRMPLDTYKQQIRRSIAKMSGVSEEAKEKLRKQTEDVDEIIRKTLQ